MSVQKLPGGVLRHLDQLWLKYSNGRFGFSVQKRIWESVGGPVEYDYEKHDRVKKLSDRVGWLKWENKWLGLKKEEQWLSYDDIIFDLNAPLGHLPGLRFVRARPGGGECGWLFSSLASRLVNCNI